MMVIARKLEVNMTIAIRMPMFCSTTNWDRQSTTNPRPTAMALVTMPLPLFLNVSRVATS